MEKLYITKFFINENIKNKKKHINFYKLTFLFILIFIIYYFNFRFKIKKNNYKLTKINYKLKKSNKNKNRPNIVAISYADKLFHKQLLINKKSAIEFGKVDKYYSYGPNDIDVIFKNKNKDILSKKRGNGYWLWKPYFILKTFKEKLAEGDYLIYTDAGILYRNSVKLIINYLNKYNAEMWVFRLRYKEKQYTKRDTFILLGADMPFFTDTNQYMGGIQIYKKSKYTEKFLEELLYYSQDKRMITDEPNILGYNNYKEFIDNRHDQSILSILIKKYGEVNSGRTNMAIDALKKQKKYMPFIFFIYRRKKFIDYNDILNKCIKNRHK